MTGPEHYAEAERLLQAVATDGKALLAAANDGKRSADITSATAVVNNLVAVAQAHATLALAWATAPSGLVAEEGTGG